MKSIKSLLVLGIFMLHCENNYAQKIFDVHLHGAKDKQAQLKALAGADVYKIALSTSWDLQTSYSDSSIEILHGLMFPCPNGKVPYSLQPCYSDGSEWPNLQWVEDQIKKGSIDFFGEILNQYFGIPANDSMLIPYYALAEKYNLPVGIHTGGAGPNHGAPNFKIELGNPTFLEPVLIKFPRLKIWAMHAGDQFYLETIRLMKKYPLLYSDISVISNPAIVSVERFATIMRAFMAAGLGNRLMFGTDSGDINKILAAIESLSFLSDNDKDNIYRLNAEQFFSK